MDQREKSNIAPKVDGLGVMISAFKSGESGRGVVVTPEQLDEVNIIWRNEKYKDERAAMEDGGLKDAKKLTSDPFVHYFKKVVIWKGIGTINTWYCN